MCVYEMKIYFTINIINSLCKFCRINVYFVSLFKAIAAVPNREPATVGQTAHALRATASLDVKKLVRRLFISGRIN